MAAIDKTFIILYEHIIKESINILRVKQIIDHKIKLKTILHTQQLIFVFILS